MNKEFERYCTFLAEMMEKYGLLAMQDILEELHYDPETWGMMQKEKTAVCGLCEELSEEFSESSIRITGILREWDVIHMKECSK